MIRLRLIALFLFGVCCVFAQENESERILSYQSDISVNADSSLLVRETIRVYVLGVDIKHGIFRDFPTIYRDFPNNYKTPWLTRFTTTFELQEVTLDGAPVPHHEEMQTNGVRSYIGDPDAFVSRGEHTYALVYRTQHQLAYWKENDELYWNVTGNGWKFPIESAEARVRFEHPGDASVLRMNGFTGPKGSTEQAYEWKMEPNTEIMFRTTRSLGAEEGFTISVMFPKGVVRQPTVVEDLKKWAADNYAIRVSLVGTFLTTLYFVFAWLLVGKDPAPGDFRARAEPPKDYSPAAARYLTRMGYDNQTFATALVSLAVKKHVSISQADNYFSVKRLDTPHGKCSPEELAVLNTLLAKDDSITFRQINHSRIASAIKACHDALRTQYETRYFLTNATYALPGTALAMITIGCALFLSPHQANNPVLFLGIWLTFWSIGCFVLAYAVVAAWRCAFQGVGQFGAAVFITAFATPFFAAEIFVTGLMFGSNAMWVLPLIVVLATLNLVFYQLMKAPTKLGRAALDQIDGFRAYLEGGGRGLPQSAVMTTPEAVEFNQYFPYAMALDLDKEWAARFAAELTDAQKDDPRYNAYYPYWYHGDMWNHRGMSGFSSSIASAMSSQISSSSTAPGSSSGFSGGSSGGSSGGGGGGGGGGGW